MKSIVIAVSSCLLGHKVRYDGNDKRNAIMESEICARFHCIPLCPEYAIGLGVPRSPIQLVQMEELRRARGKEDISVDVTARLQEYGNFICATLPLICGYIFKARSPSCAVNDALVFDSRGVEIGTAPGIYAAQIFSCRGDLPVIDEIQLADLEKRRDFIERVVRCAQSSTK